MLAERPLQGEDADRLPATRLQQALLAERVEISMPTIASPRPGDTSASDARVVEVGGRLDDGARALAAGSALLKMPEPTNTPSAPSCIISAASAGVAIPPAVKITTGRRPCSATNSTSS